MSVDQLNEISKNTLVENLGMKVIEATHGRVVMTMPIDERHRQPFGVLHGGASVALAESACSLGANLIVSARGARAVGQEINANHLRSLGEGLLEATAVILHEGRKSQVWQIEIREQNENRLVCVSRCTMAVLEGTS